MKKYWWIGLIIIGLGAGGFFYWRSRVAAQASTSASLQTATVQLGTLTATLSGSGTVRSGQNAIISWQTSGKIGDLQVGLGDKVKADQVLADLDQTALSSAMINARQNLISAKLNLDTVMNSDLLQAQALQAVETAQTALDTLMDPQLNEADAQVAVATAQNAVENAQLQLAITQSTADPSAIESAQAQVVMAKNQLDQAQAKYAPYANKPLDNLIRAQLLSRLSSAQQAYDKTVSTLNSLLAPVNPSEVAMAEANLLAAQAQLAQAGSNLQLVMDGPTPAQLAIANANLAEAQRNWDRLKNGPDPNDIAAAQAAVDIAQATLDQETLTAPFDGTITQVSVRAKDLVSSGTQAFRIDDLSTIYVDIQVAEMDVSSVKVDQPVTLTFDAIANKSYNGKVAVVGMIGNVSQGVVNYPVTVQITNPDDLVKPGMTAAVSIVIAEHSNVMMVPNQALQSAGNQRTVTVLFEGQQIAVRVTVGLANDTMSEVTSNQLKEGDTVILNSSVGSASQNPGFFPGGGGGGFIIDGP